MRSRWNDKQAPRDPLEQLVYSSRLIGQEPTLVLWGGGNTSLKGTARDFRGGCGEITTDCPFTLALW